MEYKIKCINCGARVVTDSSAVGQALVCEMCRNEFIVPLTNITSGMVQGDFWIQAHVGEGNIGDVFVAKRNSSGEKVYMKFLSPGVVGEQSVAEGFLAQMAQWGQVESPHVLAVLEAGRLAGHFYCITPYIEGECLDKRLERTGPLSEKEAVNIVIRVARVLRSCWQDHGLVHGCLSPSNILVNGLGEVYLLDAGNRKARLIPKGGQLESINFKGDIADYMSPETIESPDTQDCRSDIYSLGATMFFLLTGCRPYSGSDTTDIIRKHLAAKPPNAGKANPEVSEDVTRLIRSMMSKDLGKRITTWRDLIRRLKELMKNRTRGTQTSAMLNTTIDREPLTPAAGIRNETNNLLRGVIATMVTLVLIMFAGIGYILSRHSGVEPDPEPGGVKIVPNGPEPVAAPDPRPQPPAHPTKVPAASIAKVYLVDSKRKRVGELLDNMIVAGWGDIEVVYGGRNAHVQFFLDGKESTLEKKKPFNLLATVKPGRHTVRAVILNGQTGKVLGEVTRTFSVIEKRGNVTESKLDLERGLVGHWSFDAPPTSRVIAHPSKGLEASRKGTPKEVPGKKGKGIQFDPRDGADYMEISNPDAQLLRVTDGSFTIGCWFNPLSIPKGNGNFAIVIRPGRHTGLTYKASQQFSMEVWVGSKRVQVKSRGPREAGSFYHVVGVVDAKAGIAKLYIDGECCAERKLPGNPLKLDSGVWRFGRGNVSASNCHWIAHGILDEVRIYNRALRAAEVKVLHEL